MIYRFGGFELDPGKFELRRDGTAIAVEPQVFDILRFLIEHRDRVATRDEILDAVWSGRIVSESAVSSRIAAARQAIGDSGSAQKLIQTVHGRGFRFIGDVDIDSSGDGQGDEHGDGQATPVGTPDLRQDIQYCTAKDGIRIAYAKIGDGPPLIKAANWLSHLECDWESPIWRHWITGLATGRELVRYDERGNGLSDHDVQDLSFEAMVADLETI